MACVHDKVVHLNCSEAEQIQLANRIEFEMHKPINDITLIGLPTCVSVGFQKQCDEIHNANEIVIDLCVDDMSK